jgi:hypothetical protein
MLPQHAPGSQRFDGRAQLAQTRKPHEDGVQIPESFGHYAPRQTQKNGVDRSPFVRNARAAFATIRVSSVKIRYLVRTRVPKTSG